MALDRAAAFSNNRRLNAVRKQDRPMSPTRSRPELIDDRALKDLLAQGALTGATVVGQPEGWSVVIHCGAVDWALSKMTSQEPRLWTDLNGVAAFIENDLGLHRFDVDTTERDRDIIRRKLAGKDDILRKQREAAGYQALRTRYRSFPKE
jgi:hypothetical protein